MRIVAISCLGIDHDFVLRGLHAQHPLTLIVQPVSPEPQPAPPRAERIRRILRHPFRWLSQRLDQFQLEANLQHIETNSRRTLWGNAVHPAWDIPVHEVPRNRLHGEPIRSLLQQAAPDLLVTSGCPLLRPELFQIPRWGTINIHWGIAPAYRGEHTLFWPFYRGRTDQLGVTIHQIDRSIDGGPVLAQGYPAVDRTDDEASITAKIARLTAGLLPRVCTLIDQQQRLAGVPVRERGELFKLKDRHWYHDFWYSLRRSTGLARIVPSPAHEWISPLLSAAERPAEGEPAPVLQH
jgi:folate-dependent phosphoribosylglycinamide formyltransferase PurN